MKFKMKSFTFLILSVVFACNLYAQQDNILQLMPIVPQSAYSNPAFQPTAKWYLGFPALSSIFAGVGHNGFSYNDVIKKRSDDSLVFMGDNMMSKMGKTNFLSANFSEELLAFGFRCKKSYFSFSINEKASFMFCYPHDLIALAWKGNGQFAGKTADLSGIDLNAVNYTEYAIGFSRDFKIFNQNFVFGVRIKYLQGLMNVSTPKNKVNIQIDENNFDHTANADFLVNATVPDALLNSMKDSLIKNTPAVNDTSLDPAKYFFNTTNQGYAIDLGVCYKLNKKFTFGISLIDLGSIHWNSGSESETRNLSSSVSSYYFDGIDYNQIFKPVDSTFKQAVKNLGDTANKYFKIRQSQNGYWSAIPARIYLTGEYNLTPKAVVGLLYRGDIFDGRIFSSYSASLNKRFGNFFSASVSYSIINRSFSNVGVGMALNLGAWQTYVCTDNICCLLNPEGARIANVHFGINFIFGYKVKKPSQSLYQVTPVN